MSRITSRPQASNQRAPCRRVLLIAVVAVVTLFAAACGEDPPRVDEGTQPDVEGAQPSGEGSTFVDEISALPTPAAADAVSDPEIGETFATQSYLIPGFTPERVLTYYSRNLPEDWETTEPPEQIGSASWQGEWVKGSLQLEVSSARARAGDAEEEATHSQFSLIVRQLD